MTGRKLNRLLNLGAEHALYREDGKWYHHLTAFPGVLFDKNGYLIFENEDVYTNHHALRHRQDLNVPTGIAEISGYMLFNDEQKVIALNVIVGKKNEQAEETIRKIREVEYVLRNRRLVEELKKLYDNTCQICGIKLQLSESTFYSEVHHIVPLGRPHNGADRLENMVCVCPNDHVLLDLRAIPLKDLKVLKHEISPQYVSFHNSLYETQTRESHDVSPDV
jgi:5-methylcytosine-specific restriction protein A